MEKFTFIKNNPSLDGSYIITPNVVYRTVDGQELNLHESIHGHTNRTKTCVSR